MLRPSRRASRSTIATLFESVATRSRSRLPCWAYVTSRPRLLVFFRLLVFQPAVVGQATDRRHGRGRDFDQVDSPLAGQHQGVARGHDAELGAVVRDHADLRYADLFVDTERATNGLSPQRWVLRFFE
jgi:hypothetical protein